MSAEFRGLTTTALMPNASESLSLEERLELAGRLYREYHTRCFWHCPRDLVITEDLIPLVVNGLRKHGGHRGFILAGKLPQGRLGRPQRDYYRAEARRGEDQLPLDWTNDTAFRFFPVVPDEEFGSCLHQADLAINKFLALAGRAEFRDYLDTLQIDESYLSLGSVARAACGKDTGYTPPLLLDMANRHACFRESDVKGESLARPVDLRELKKQWLAALARAAGLFSRLPAEELGCLYLNAENKPVTPDPDHADFPGLKRHWGSVRGAWPKFS